MPPKPLGADYVNNCLVSAGYTWCEILNKCVRVWEEMCSYPDNCLTWNDGCNVCQLNNGELGYCSERYCLVRDMPSCIVQKPDVFIEPVVDPLPPVINPFIGDGH
jgi:hypothetical protein